MKKIITLLLILTAHLSYGQNPDVKLPGDFVGWPNNYFTAGTGDGGSLSTYNVYLRLHYGMAIGSPYTSNGNGGYVEKTTISFDGRNGDVKTVGNISAVNAQISGGMGIGTTNIGNNKLAVGGALIAESVTVKLQGSWPDYVFQPDYQLPSLSFVKAYITKNRHLPDLPSEKEIAAQGQDLGEINKQLTKKVEELTLYLIEKEEKDKQQQLQIDQLKDQVAKIMAKLK